MMPPQYIVAAHVEAAVRKIIPYLEDARDDAPKVIYFNGWENGLGASAVLRAIAEHPPPYLLEKFDKIIHLDCSRWESRRSLQRAIADELELARQVAADFDRQDEDDDFAGVDQGSRAEIGSVAKVIARSTAQHRCLVVFHNGSDDTVDLTRCGVQLSEFFSTKVLWTFGGRLHRTWSIGKNLDEPSLVVAVDPMFCVRGPINWNALVAEEAREIALYAHNKQHGAVGGGTVEIATECCLYLMSLHHGGGGVIDYNWVTHAASYWVCDGIIGGGGRGSQLDNQAWELARDLQEQIKLERYSSDVGTPPSDVAGWLSIPHQRWISTTGFYLEAVPPGTTSLFFAPPPPQMYHPQAGWFLAPKPPGSPIVPSLLPSDSFHEAKKLRVLKLCHCTFSFSSPPFHCCNNLRFLGLDRCMDEQQLGVEEEETGGARAVETFQRLWVLDVCHTDWQLDFPLETEDQAENKLATTSIREVHINNGRIWRSNLAWRRLPSLRRLQVVDPTSSWETAGTGDEFMGMVNLEHLDLSANSTMQILPCSLSTATGLKTLVLDGCVELERVVGPQAAGGLPPSLESFSLDAGSRDDQKKNEARISCISLAGCAKLSDFRLRGPLPELEELDLSHTAIKRLDLEEVGVGNLQRLLLMGCEQLRSISWPRSGVDKLRLVCINTPADMRFLLSLMPLTYTFKKITSSDFRMDLCLSSSPPPTNTGQLAVPPLPKPSAYHDVCIIIQQIAAATAAEPQQPPMNFHMEIGEGVCDVPIKLESKPAIMDVLDKIKSLHVHDSSSITTVTPEHIFLYSGNTFFYGKIMNGLKWCRVERCPKLDTVFPTSYDSECFYSLETFWATHLLMARSIWSRPTKPRWAMERSFRELQSIYLHFCPRLRYVLLLASAFALPEVLETLHILCCGDLRQVFPVEENFLKKIAAFSSTEKGPRCTLRFPKLKVLYLHELPSLQQICEAKMFAPNLETIYIRGCWSLRSLPATTEKKDGRPHVAVDCEKEWWHKLEWDGAESGHHPSLFQPRHGKYYKKRHLRGTVLL